MPAWGQAPCATCRSKDLEDGDMHRMGLPAVQPCQTVHCSTPAHSLTPHPHRHPQLPPQPVFTEHPLHARLCPSHRVFSLILTTSPKTGFKDLACCTDGETEAPVSLHCVLKGPSPHKADSASGCLVGFSQEARRQWAVGPVLSSWERLS